MSEDVDVVALDTYRRNVDDVARLGERVHAVSVGKVLGALEFLASSGRSVKIESRDGETILVIDYPEARPSPSPTPPSLPASGRIKNTEPRRATHERRGYYL